jgi:hypothetical protein
MAFTWLAASLRTFRKLGPPGDVLLDLREIP